MLAAHSKFWKFVLLFLDVIWGMMRFLITILLCFVIILPFFIIVLFISLLLFDSIIPDEFFLELSVIYIIPAILFLFYFGSKIRNIVDRYFDHIEDYFYRISR